MLKTLDSRAIDELIYYYRPLLYEIARREWNHKLERRIGISDVVQSTLVSMVEALPNKRFADRNHFKKYITTILRNHLQSFRRMIFSQKRSLERDVSYDTEIELRLYTGKKSHSELDRLIDTEFAKSVLAAILKLPRELQRIIRWRYRKGLTLQDIANRIDRKPEQVRYLIDKCLIEISRDLRLDRPK